MSQRPFRFLHAADLHLDQPPEGLGEVPPHLVDALVDAPFGAAKRVFDAAIDHHVEFVVLSGDVVDLRHAAPRELTFLVEQFARLAERNIAVYWNGGDVDSLDWPSRLALPKNVRRFSSLHPEPVRHERQGELLCCLIGGGDGSGTIDIGPKSDESAREPMTILVVHGDAARFRGRHGGDYIALGGSHARHVAALGESRLAHDPGTPQGRRPSECGDHGCTLVSVDEARQMRLSMISTSVVRWQPERLELSAIADRAELEKLLRERMSSLLAEAGGATLLVDWRIVCDGKLFGDLRRGRLSAELLDQLQSEYGHRSPAAWTTAVRPELPSELPMAWMQEDTIRGDFARTLKELLEAHDAEGVDLDALLEMKGLLVLDDAGQVVSRRLRRAEAQIDDAELQRRILCEAAWLGADLLSSEEAVR